MKHDQLWKNPRNSLYGFADVAPFGWSSFSLKIAMLWLNSSFSDTPMFPLFGQSCAGIRYTVRYTQKKKVNTYLYIYSMCTWGNCDKTTINYENKLLWLWYIINYDKLLQGCSIFRQTHQVMPQRLRRRRRLRRELLERLAVWCSM